MRPLQVATILLRQLLQSRAALAAENLALRQQVAVLQRTAKRPRLRRMSRDNPTWGRRRIRSELHLLGHEVAELTVAKYRFSGTIEATSRMNTENRQA